MNKFLGFQKTQNTDAFTLFPIIKLGKFALRYTTKNSNGLGIGIFRDYSSSIYFQISKLTVLFRWESR